MSTIMPAPRRQAEDLQALLDGRRASTPAAARDLAPLVALARALAPAEHSPAPAFRAALRERLLLEAADRPQAPAGRVPAPRPSAAARLRQAVAAVAVAAVLAGVGVAAASTRALPGNQLYGLKRQIEGVELSLARGDVGHGRELLEQADARLSEAERLTAGEHGSDPATRALVAQALDDMDAAVTLGADDLTRAYRETGDDEPMLLLDRFVTDQRERLDDLLQLLDPALRARVRALADRLAALDRQVSAVLGTTSSAQVLTHEALTAPGDGWAVGRLVDQAAGTATGGGAVTGVAAGGDEGSTSSDGVEDVVGAVGDAAGAATGADGGSGTTSGGSGVGDLLGGATPTQLPTRSPSPLPTVSVQPLPTSSPLLTDPVGTVTSAVPLPTSSALPSVSVCVPLPPLSAC